MTEFSNFDLSENILKALSAQGYARPTPIQAAAIPAILDGADLLGIAQTGTGKTAAFALPILDILEADPRPAPRKGCRVLVLAPTRELSNQIADSFRKYGSHLRLKIATVVGGVAPRPQIRALANGLDVLIATPGRLLDHMGAGHCVLRDTEILVLDEADQMLDLGFVKPIRQIVAQLHKDRQTILFSATMPDAIGKLAREFLHDPVRAEVAPTASTAEGVSQRVIHVGAQRKMAYLAELLANPDMARTIVFTRTKRGADRVAKHLDKAAISSAAIHGNKSQSQRERALEAFRRSKVRVLVATDIAARGIDVNSVSHVVNYELPEVAEVYVHRIGRTARAGASGMAISLCDATERPLLRGIERLTRQSIPSETVAGESLPAEIRIERTAGERNPRNDARKSRPRRAPQRRPRDAERFRDGTKSDEQSAGRGEKRSPARFDRRSESPAQGQQRRSQERVSERADDKPATRSGARNGSKQGARQSERTRERLGERSPARSGERPAARPAAARSRPPKRGHSRPTVRSAV